MPRAGLKIDGHVGRRAGVQKRSFDFHLEALAIVSYAGLTIREFPITYVFSNISLTRRVVAQAFLTWVRLLLGLPRRPSGDRQKLP